MNTDEPSIMSNMTNLYNNITSTFKGVINNISMFIKGFVYILIFISFCVVCASNYKINRIADKLQVANENLLSMLNPFKPSPQPVVVPVTVQPSLPQESIPEQIDAAETERYKSRYPAGFAPGTMIAGSLSPTVNTGTTEWENPNYYRRSALWSPTDQEVLEQQVWKSN